MSISLLKHNGLLEVDLDLPARGVMVPARLKVTRAGLEVRPKGRRFAASAPWWKILRALALPPSAPAKFCSDVEGFLADAALRSTVASSLRSTRRPLETRKPRSAGSIGADAVANRATEGGSIPTPALHPASPAHGGLSRVHLPRRKRRAP